MDIGNKNGKPYKFRARIGLADTKETHRRITKVLPKFLEERKVSDYTLITICDYVYVYYEKGD